jgi:hypothetical protein
MFKTFDEAIEELRNMKEEFIWQKLREYAASNKEVQDRNQEGKTQGPEETEVGIREEGSSLPRAE